jgi:imidazolonepropionase-like amidohydrolase
MSQPLVIRFGTLHDQLGPPKRDGVLLVADGRVAEVDAGAGGLDVPDGALVVDAACVVPGLINAHGHLEQDAGAEGAGWFARTTPTQRAITAAGPGHEQPDRDRGPRPDPGGEAAGPTVVAAGRVICVTGGHGAFVGREADGPEQAVMRAPGAASRRVLRPSPQPTSRHASPSTGGSSAKNAGVFTRSR